MARTRLKKSSKKLGAIKTREDACAVVQVTALGGWSLFGGSMGWTLSSLGTDQTKLRLFWTGVGAFVGLLAGNAFTHNHAAWCSGGD